MSCNRKLVLISSIATSVVVAASWMLGSALSAPAMRAIGPAPPALDARPVSFPSDSGSTIQGWLVEGAPGRGALVLAHSARSNRLEMVERAVFLSRAGYSVLLFDAQAHGDSPGARITFGYLESLDSLAAVAFLRSKLPGERIGYLGVSQGGAAALLGPEPLPVQSLVLESVYPTLREAVANRIEIRLGSRARFLAHLLLLQVRPRLGADPAVLSPIQGIREIRAPLLLIVGAEDRHTPLAESRRLFAAAPDPKSLWVIPGAAHVDFHRFGPGEYQRRTLEFLSESLYEAMRVLVPEQGTANAKPRAASGRLDCPDSRSPLSPLTPGRRCRATPDPSSHDRVHRLPRAKYGNAA